MASLKYFSHIEPILRLFNMGSIT
jgi:hypothetical protein